jgi:hypothetical protein
MLSVPYALESLDGKDENARAPSQLLGRTWDPIVGPFADWSQRLNATAAPARSHVHQRQDLTDLVVADAGDNRGQTSPPYGRVALDLRGGNAKLREIAQERLDVARLHHSQHQPHCAPSAQ